MPYGARALDVESLPVQEFEAAGEMVEIESLTGGHNLPATAGGHRTCCCSACIGCSQIELHP